MSLITLFDKSFLQSLSVDESVWFDHFFAPNVCPYFFVETLADLEKRTGSRDPEEEVRIIADKFPDKEGIPNAYHKAICLNELMGGTVPQTGQILVSGGTPAKSGPKSVMAFDEFPENDAFSRWREKQFQDLEREYAARWRAALNNVDLEGIANSFQKLGLTETKCKNLDEARRMARDFAISDQQRSDRTQLALVLLGIDRQYHHSILARWSTLSYKPIASFAPYCAHVVEVELFYQFAVQSGLIFAERVSNRVDIAYLFYLPFCRMFASSDRLHKRCTPLFLRPDQEFVWGPDLKRGLRELNEHYGKLPNDVKAKGISSFAAQPPTNGDYFVSKLYDRHVPAWRARARPKRGANQMTDSEILAELEKLKRAQPISHDEIDFDVQAPDASTLQRRVRQKKGSWYQLPKDLKNTDQ